MAVTALASTTGRIALVVHPTRPQARELASLARSFWESHGHPVVELSPDAREAAGDLDLAVSLGGDGTMLRSVQLAVRGGVPVLGINLGALGYLTSVEPEALEQSFVRLLDGDYSVEERMTLDVTVDNAGGPRTLIALNEAVLERTAPGHTIRLQVHIGGKAFLSYLADGFLAATPSGSTAYNLSLRGPIVSPRLRAIVITPIAAHMLFDRAMVLEPEETVVLELLENRPAGLVVDGLDVGTLQPGDTITLRAGAHPARLVTFERGDFYGVLRAKFNLADRERAVISELRVRELGVIEDVNVVLGAGLTVISGETGAGKTLVVEALELLLGARADPTMVRHGAPEAVIEGRFVDDDHELVLARAVPAEGRSRAYVDGKMAPVARLEELGRDLVDLHGQHAHQSLLHPAAQRGVLDTYLGIDLGPLHELRQQLSELDRRLVALGGPSGPRERELDLLRFELGEITAAAIESPDEDIELAREEEVLSEAGALRSATALASQLIEGSGDDSALDRLGAAIEALGRRPPLAGHEGRLRGLVAELADVGAELRRDADRFEEDPERLAAVQERRHDLARLARKHGGELADVLRAEEVTRARIAELESNDANRTSLEGERLVLVDKIAHIEDEIGGRRRAGAAQFARAVEAHLRELALPNARLEVELSDHGLADDITLLLGANPGEPALPLTKVASGGELARTMLALRLVLTTAPPTLVFDEVDAGIGGEVAVAVGRSLAELARTCQVLVVTHLAQVAAHADHQFVVEKSESGGRTRSWLLRVEGEDRLIELSRMLSGQPRSASARRHAAELLAQAHAH